MLENADQNNSEYRYFLRSTSYQSLRLKDDKKLSNY